MEAGGFQFEDCLLKHFIRREVWLPKCRAQLKVLKSETNKSKKRPPRRMRYFTFCAVGALDVLLLDREKILKKSSAKEFDTVFFFDRDEDAVSETRKRIPGANGFPGDFVKVVLEAEQGAGLEAPANAENTREVREAQQKRAQHEKFLKSFPFDVINLDVEQYLFRPKEELPGKLTTALRRLFDWQKRQGETLEGQEYGVDEFALMFTTQVGPKNLPDDYLTYLRDTCLQQNLASYPELQEPFNARSGGKTVAAYFTDDFDKAFKLAVPKSLIELAFESDWHIEGNDGIEIFEFDRQSKDGPYTMLHMAMTVRRQTPAKEKRAPGQKPPDVAQAEHKQAVARLFQNDAIDVEELVVGERKDELEADLGALFEHRKRYYSVPDTTSEG